MTSEDKEFKNIKMFLVKNCIKPNILICMRRKENNFYYLEKPTNPFFAIHDDALAIMKDND